ncbi:hypothetical protein DLR64_17665 [Vibrio tarriae]|nr:DUF645 family protein [Vibrio cholerae]RBM24557.1 hypothetical protein DLR59_18980 [Vibrio tarriae]RBM26911.1 hypothetical protein DLR61_15900 [Vibrio tarriae]RBM33162.1 hypothetical protein DLR58_13100 [Vibrio tarriae]RBM45973.1 hypothetical protein DLR64_17665 [Vibrio tarriae]
MTPQLLVLDVCLLDAFA